MKPVRVFLSLMVSSLIVWGIYLFFATDTKSRLEGEKSLTVKEACPGGMRFKAENLTLRLALVESAMPAHFRACLMQDGKALAVTGARLQVKLSRFNKRVDTLDFTPAGTFLQSTTPIREPHSFDMSITLQFGGKTFHWSASAHEGRVQLSPAVINAAGIRITTVGSQTIRTRLTVVGKITANRDTMAPIYARYSGIIQKMHKNLGDEVNKGELLATIESNESLQNYTISSPISGTIVQKYATNGELAQNTRPIYEVANLNNVWADFTLYRKDLPLVKRGMTVIVTPDEGTPETISTISYIAPLGTEDSQTTLARAILPNTPRLWLPGMYVNGAIIVKDKQVPVAVRLSALQTIGNHEVVFVNSGDEFEATPVKTGARDTEWVEVVSGLEAGQQVVETNSFYIKAEIGKEGAGHDHGE